jgi:hypothetical protein
MLSVTVDQQPFAFNTGDIRTVTQLVEYLKATIDPDRVITGLSFSGAPLSEVDWVTPLSMHGGKTLEVYTGSKEGFVRDRLGAAADYVRQIAQHFATASGLLRSNQANSGNLQLSGAVKDLSAFLGWYASVVALEPQALDELNQEFHRQIEDINATCEVLVQMQLAQSWPAIGEIVHQRLHPQLQKLQGLCASSAELI